MDIFVTGGAGYIGSHPCVELLNAGHNVVVLDNFGNSHTEALQRVERISRRKPVSKKGDVRYSRLMQAALTDHRCDAVIHFAGLKAVAESTEISLQYYDHNVVGSIRLLEAMQQSNARILIFSSSAMVYGNPMQLPIPETHPLADTNPYGRTKIAVEEILQDFHHAQPDWRIGILGYFNPVEAYEGGLLGEDPQGQPNNLVPFVARVASGRLPRLKIWGDDYPTPDGTGVQNYINVTDLAYGHLRALDYLTSAHQLPVNLGTGRGSRVLKVVKAFEVASGCPVPYNIAPRRLGDVPTCYADSSLAESLLGWRAERNLATMCEDAWRWQSASPNGFSSKAKQ